MNYQKNSKLLDAKVTGSRKASPIDRYFSDGNNLWRISQGKLHYKDSAHKDWVKSAFSCGEFLKAAKKDKRISEVTTSPRVSDPRWDRILKIVL